MHSPSKFQLNYLQKWQADPKFYMEIVGTENSQTNNLKKTKQNINKFGKLSHPISNVTAKL